MSETGGQQIAFGDAMDAFPAWTSLESSLGVRVSGWRIRRGRVDETQRTGTGTASVYVNDLEGYFAAGTDFPTHAQLSLRGSPRFRGHVEEINVDVVGGMPEDLPLSRVSIECVDIFDHLSRFELYAGLNGDVPPDGQEQYVFYDVSQVDDRIITVLNEAGVDPSLQSVFSGNVELFPKSYQTGTTAQQVLDECADAEWPGVSNRFVDSTGRYCFRGRHARFAPSNPTYGIQFWEAGTGSNVTSGRAQIRALRYGTSRSLIVNTALAYPQGMDEKQIAQMTTVSPSSIATYGVRSWSAENLLTKRHLSNGNTGADEALLFSTYQVLNYAQPRARVTGVQFRSLRDSDTRAEATWALMQGVEIGDVIDLFTGAISGRYFVEGITIEARELDGDIPFAVVDLDLSPQEFWETDPF